VFTKPMMVCVILKMENNLLIISQK
jgi:hypothetical protein